jgi:LysR family transcriptional regulator, chromosome initiation inhibitor
MHRSAYKKLDVDWLESLNALQACGQFVLAAKQLGISQSALSQRVAKLEDSMGLPLVLRTSPVRLTPTGHRLMVYSHSAQQLVATINEELHLLLDSATPDSTEPKSGS